MFWLESLTVHAYRNVAPGTHLEFHRGKNVLVGLNGSGKTNLLNLIAMVAAQDFRPLRDERGVTSLEFVVAWEGAPTPGTTRLAMWFDAESGGVDRLAPPKWRLRGEFYTPGAILEGATFRVSSSETPAFNPHVPDSTLQIQRSLTPFDYSFMTHMLGVWASAFPTSGNLHIFTYFIALGDALSDSSRSVAGRFDEALGAFASFTSGQALNDWSPAGFVFRFFAHGVVRASMPHDIFHRAVATTNPTDGATAISWSSEDSPPLALETLQRIRDQLGLRSLKATPRFSRSTPDGAEYVGCDFFAELRTGYTVHHDQLSFGQKRMLAFIWYCACAPDAPIIADELVNGFHHAWITASLDLIGERQAFLATQNPLLLDYLEFDTAEDVARAFILCSIDDQGRWVWRNPAETEASDFLAAYDVGIQHVSEILRDKGLW